MGRPTVLLPPMCVCLVIIVSECRLYEAALAGVRFRCAHVLCVRVLNPYDIAPSSLTTREITPPNGAVKCGLHVHTE
jgi:hypothetical protein